MAGGAGQRWVVDSSTIIWFERQTPRDVFPSLWAQLDADIAAGAWIVPKEVLRELEAGDDELAAWCAGVPGLVVEATDAEVGIVGQIVAAHPDWVADNRNQADPWVIAHAVVAGVAILTEERPAPVNASDKKLKINNVARERGVSCQTRLEYQRSMGWAL